MGIAEKTVKEKNNKIKNANIDVMVIDNEYYTTVTITIDQMIEPQMRPRTGRYNNVYDPLGQYKEHIRKKVLKKLEDNNFKIEISEDKYIEADIILQSVPPKSLTNHEKIDALKGNRKFNKKPDIDNCVKTIYDSFEDIFFFNDSQIVKESFEKRYGFTDQTIIVLRIFDQYESKKGRLTKAELESLDQKYIDYLKK